jgi:hypothetical protein
MCATGSAHRCRRRALLACVAALVVAQAGCTYDFDAPFGGTASGSGDALDASPDATGGFAGDAGTGDAGGSGVTERCDDRTDNDIDELVDCADPDCSAIATCVGEVPWGWSGPFWLSARAWSDPLPPAPHCAAGAERYFGGPAGSAVCSPCECGPMTGSWCEQASFRCRLGGSTCGGAYDYTGEFVGNCLDFFAPLNGDIACTTGPTNGVAGACQPSEATFDNQAPFQRVLDLCPASVDLAGCVQGTLCAATPAQGWSEYLCIRRAGGEACPPSWPTPFDAYGKGVDSRGCTACDCQTLQVAPVCSQDVYYLVQAEGCVDFGPFPSFSGGNCVSYHLSSTYLERWSFLREPGSLQSEGACMPTGGQPVGAVSVEDPVTICCMPVL